MSTPRKARPRRPGGKTDDRRPDAAPPAIAAAGSVADQAERARVRAALEKQRAGKQLSRADITVIRNYEERRASEQWWGRARRLPQHELIAFLEASIEQVKRWRNAGMPAIPDGRRVYYDLPAVIAWLKRHWLDRGESRGITKQDAEVKLLIRREAALQLKMQIMSGELIHRDQVTRENCQKILAVKSGLLALERTLAPSIAELGPDAPVEDVAALIHEHVDGLLRAFAGQAGHEQKHPVRTARGRLVSRRKARVGQLPAAGNGE